MKCFLTIILNLTLEENGIAANKKVDIVKAACLKMPPMVCSYSDWIKKWIGYLLVYISSRSGGRISMASQAKLWAIFYIHLVRRYYQWEYGSKAFINRPWINDKLVTTEQFNTLISIGVCYHCKHKIVNYYCNSCITIIPMLIQRMQWLLVGGYWSLLVLLTYQLPLNSFP